MTTKHLMPAFSIFWYHTLVCSIKVLRSWPYKTHIYTVQPTHHTIGVGVTGLRDRQALNDFRSHPGKSAHHCHMRSMGQELGSPKVTNLESQQERREKWRNSNITCVLELNEKWQYVVFHTRSTNLQYFVSCHNHCEREDQSKLCDNKW